MEIPAWVCDLKVRAGLGSWWNACGPSRSFRYRLELIQWTELFFLLSLLLAPLLLFIFIFYLFLFFWVKMLVG